MTVDTLCREPRRSPFRSGYTSQAIFLALTLIALSVCTSANSTPKGTPDHLMVSRGFFEFAPIVSKIIVKKGTPFIEVFLEGEIPAGLCFDKKEYLVEVKTDFTEVIARFHQNNPDTECKAKVRPFYDKIADLDPANPASQLVKVLSFYGWTQGRLQGSGEIQ